MRIIINTKIYPNPKQKILQMDSQFIKKAIVVNSILVVYFCTSNLSSFFGIVLAIGMFSTAGLMGFLSKKPEG